MVDPDTVAKVAGGGDVTTGPGLSGLPTDCTYRVGGEDVVGVSADVLPSAEEAVAAAKMAQPGDAPGREIPGLGDYAYVYSSTGIPGLVMAQDGVFIGMTPIAPDITEADLVTLARSASKNL